jgi:hypothetical protein
MNEYIKNRILLVKAIGQVTIAKAKERASTARGKGGTDPQGQR